MKKKGTIIKKLRKLMQNHIVKITFFFYFYGAAESSRLIFFGLIHITCQTVELLRVQIELLY